MSASLFGGLVILGNLAHSCQPLLWRIRHSSIPICQSITTKCWRKDQYNHVEPINQWLRKKNKCLTVLQRLISYFPWEKMGYAIHRQLVLPAIIKQNVWEGQYRAATDSKSGKNRSIEHTAPAWSVFSKGGRGRKPSTAEKNPDDSILSWVATGYYLSVQMTFQI